MKNPNSFEQVLRTATLLVFALSFNAFNVVASENGNYAGPDFLNNEPSSTTVQPMPQRLAKVKGYKVESALSNFGSNANAGSIQTIINPIDDDEPTPMPIVTTSTPTSTPTSSEVDVSISSIQVRSRSNPYDATDKYEIVVRVLNNSAIALTQYDLFRSILRVTAGTNDAAITACNVGSCENVGNSYNASMYLSAPSVSSIPANSQQEYLFNSQTFLGSRPEFVPGVQYTIKAIVDDNAYFNEKVETNNTSSTYFTAQNSTQCAQAGLRADIYGGPNQVCCAGLVLQGGLCNVPQPTTPTTTPPVLEEEKITICHLTGANTALELTIDKSAWENGHAKHTGDHIKSGSLPCRPPKVPTEPLAVNAPVTSSPVSEKDALIRKLQERIAKLEYKLSQVEQSVIEREKEREQNIDSALTNRLVGRLLIQPESKGEVWYLDPTTKQKFFLKDGDGAYQALKAFGTGISEEDFAKIKDSAFARTLRGKILLRVHSHGEAYYIDDAGVPHYLKDGAAAYALMKNKALGVSNNDLSKITTGSLAD